MLSKQRHLQILQMLKEKDSITLQEIKDRLHISESTIRRDLNTLDEQGLLVKVFGGAIVPQAKNNVLTKDDTVSLREEVHKEEKIRIARYAAGLVSEGDFVYLDAGTTTGSMIPYLPVNGVTYVTDSVSHAKLLAQRGASVRIIGGEVKATTEALVGSEAYMNLKMFHFTLGFFGGNGIDLETGFTTPDINEALIKQCAMEHSRKCYVLCDASKFDQISSVTFGGFETAFIITGDLHNEAYQQCENIIRAPKE